MTDETELDEYRVTLRVNGLEFAGVGGKRWASVQVDTSIEDLASSFSVAALGVFATEESFINEGDAVEVWVGADRLVTGYVDDVEHAGDAENETVRVSGRSKTCDLVDCSAPIGTWRGLTLARLIAVLCDGYEVEIVDEAGVGGTIIRQHRTEEGETIFDALDRLGRDIGFVPTDDGAGRLVLTRAGESGAAGEAIVRGAVGFLEGGTRRSMAERFSTYQCKGQSFTDLEVDASATGGASDVGVTRTRTLIVRPERGLTRAGAADRAAWEATTRAAKALEANYTLRGWRKADGELWQKNQMAEVLDGFARLIGAELLIVGLSFTLDPEAGRKVGLRLAPREAFTPAPSKRVDVTPYAQADLETTAPEFDGGEEGDW